MYVKFNLLVRCIREPEENLSCRIHLRQDDALCGLLNYIDKMSKNVPLFIFLHLFILKIGPGTQKIGLYLIEIGHFHHKLFRKAYSSHAIRVHYYY